MIKIYSCYKCGQVYREEGTAYNHHTNTDAQHSLKKLKKAFGKYYTSNVKHKQGICHSCNKKMISELEQELEREE